MVEWVFGITDRPPWTWCSSFEPTWQDETLVATSSHTFHDMMIKLCNTALKKRRQCQDETYGIEDHCWEIQIESQPDACDNKNRKKRSAADGALEDVASKRDDDTVSSGDEEDSEDNDDDKYRGKIRIVNPERVPMEQRNNNWEDDEIISSTTTLNHQLVPMDSVLTCIYDYGTTTTFYLKVISIRYYECANTLLQYFIAKYDDPKQERDLQSIPAYSLPKGEQLDAHYPNVSKAMLGYYVPLLQPAVPTKDGDGDDDDDDDHDDEEGMGQMAGEAYNNKVGGSSCLGLGMSSRIRTDQDTTFCFMEDSTSSSDLLYCSLPFCHDWKEFWSLAETSWTPRNPESDPDHLQKYRYNCICRHLFPSTQEGKQVREIFETQHQNDPCAMYGPKAVLFYNKEDDDDHGTNDDDGTSMLHNKTRASPVDEKKKDGFDFAKQFPKTNEQFSNGKFRWFLYKNNILRVLVGRGKGPNHRSYESNQILRTWNRSFTSLHELFCAVEASWHYQGQPLKTDTILDEFDTNLGPSNPGPKEPKVLGSQHDMVVISNWNNKKKLVTALVIGEMNDTSYLFSGHEDGTLVCWNLLTNQQYWSKQIYEDTTDQVDRKHLFFVKDTDGVAGIIVEKDITNPKDVLLYAWSHAIEGLDFENRSASHIREYQGSTGTKIGSFRCDVGYDEDGNKAYPSVATVVLCRLLVDNTWKNSLIVGLHCLPGGRINWNHDYADFDLDEVHDYGKGNILPFDRTTRQRMETWNDHQGIIQAMGVVPDQYLVSLSMLHGTGLPDAMILWDLANPGIPLCRYDFYNPKKSRLDQYTTRLNGVCGISIVENEILIACEFGDRVAVMTIEEELARKGHRSNKRKKTGRPSLKLHGYSNIGHRYYEGEHFHGRMAMVGQYSIMANAGFEEVWLFDIPNNVKYNKLDRRDGNLAEFQYNQYGSDDDDGHGYRHDDDSTSKYRFAGREMAQGKVVFPLFGGNKPKGRPERKETSFFFSSETPITDDDDDDGMGDGGPVSLALGGEWIVAGYSNGTIVRSPRLVDFAIKSNNSNDMACCSSLPSDQWFCPVLEVNDEIQEVNNERRPDKSCIVQ